MKRIWPLALTLVAGAALAQQPGEIELQAKLYIPGFQFTSSSRLVQVPVVVTDSAGHAVAGLRAADFTVLDNGRPQAVTDFSAEIQAAPASAAAPALSRARGQALAAAPSARPPRSIALVFDDLDTPPANLSWCRQAALRYLEQDAVPGDHWAVLTTSEEVAQPFTADRAALARALAKVRGFTEPLSQDDPDTPPELRMSPEMIALFGAHTLSGIRDAVEYTAAQPGERELLLASNGFKTKHLDSQVAALTALALRAQVVVNTLDAFGLDTADKIGEHRKPKHVLQRAADTNVLFTMARDTGGTLVENTNVTS
ncbi:MAG: VWA domain-containing protein, partial [Terriglobales bacterium]